MLWITIIITGIVFFATQILLFWFSYRYQDRPNRKSYYFPHNNKLEVIWTVVPAITLTILVGFGLKYWFEITSDAPKDALEVEITGKQFGWIYRYAGDDGQFGKKYYRNIDPGASNDLGLLWDDPATHDDIILTTSMYIVKDRPVKLRIGAQDVVHSVGLPHFRMKMDAVPGTPTTMWFTPKYTTAEMKKMTNNPDFVYEIACDQMCGAGHFSMRGTIEVVTQEEFDLWIAKQKSGYHIAFPDKDPSNAPQNGASQDSTSSSVKADEAKEKEIAKK
jgi:cytochrome c oxidase subunit 2